MMDNNNLNIEKLRHDLIDYYGTAMYGGFPAALVDLAKIERASAEELVRVALRNGMNLNRYLK